MYFLPWYSNPSILVSLINLGYLYLAIFPQFCDFWNNNSSKLAIFDYWSNVVILILAMFCFAKKMTKIKGSSTITSAVYSKVYTTEPDPSMLTWVGDLCNSQSANWALFLWERISNSSCASPSLLSCQSNAGNEDLKNLTKFLNFAPARFLRLAQIWPLH